ncbi:MAG: hypothetical protein MUF06_23600 [Pirellulaceae bacterium]|nr:hypothetical protein [Pirellulaceae bacterium]
MTRGLFHRLGKKPSRRQQRDQPRPVFWRGQLSLTAFLLLTTAVAIYVTFFRMVLDAATKPLDVSFEDTPSPALAADAPRVEFVVTAAIVVGLILALKAGWIVYRAPPKIGTAMVWVLCCGGILGVSACLFLRLGHHRGLDANRARLEFAMQGALYFVSLVVPLGALIGGYLRSAWQRESS